MLELVTLPVSRLTELRDNGGTDVRRRGGASQRLEAEAVRHQVVEEVDLLLEGLGGGLYFVPERQRP